MNYKQMKLYRAEWAKARDVLKTQGRATNPDTEEYERMLIHESITGTRCSSKDLSDDQLDQVLAAFYVTSAQLDKYLDLKAQPETRCKYLADDILDRISAHFIALERPKEAIERGPGRDGYILYLARRFSTNKCLGGLAEIDCGTWYKIIACLRIRFDQVTRKKKAPGKGAKRSRPYDKPSRRYDQKAVTPRPERITAVN